MLAFPGMGKTPLAKRESRYFDLDFGFFRSALSVPKEEEAKLLKPFAKFAKMYADQGYIVLTNEPKLMDVMKITKVYLPKDPKFSAKKLKVPVSTAAEWIQDWKDRADKHHIPVVIVSTGLDHYLGKGGHRHGN
jgi:hypothetical protein